MIALSHHDTISPQAWRVSPQLATAYCARGMGFMKSIKISEFKVRCLALLDQVRNEGETFLILDGGRPVAQVGPVQSPRGRYPQDDLKGSVEILGDLLAPVLPADSGRR
jgi:antitoxin (DNA-binding transcriptional repressor) of toxin-antitoxin stability system